jgi:nucleoid DNA-binding protein
MILSDFINKTYIWKCVNLKINNIVPPKHTLAIINILINEIFLDLKAGKTLKINNFCTMKIRENEPRKHYSLFKRRVVTSPGKKNLKISLDKKFVSNLKKYLDLDLSYRNGDNES